MGYSALASSIRSNADLYTDSITAIRGLNFKSVWKGPASESTIGILDQAIAKLSAEQSGLNFFASILDKVQVYKDNKEKLETLEDEYNKLPNTKANYNRRVKLWNDIKTLYNQNVQLKESIISALSSVSVDELDATVIAANMVVAPSYILDVNSLLALFRSGKLRKLADGDSLYKYISEEQVLAGLQDIKNKYSGREAAVNSALYILQIAADCGIKLDYQHKGTNPRQPYVPTSQLASGIDCNPFTSWVVDKGVEGGFQWRPVESFKSVGQAIPYENWNNAQPGDVFVVANDSGRHVGVIIENHPESGTFVCAEASGSTAGIILQTRSYGSLRGSGYSVQDMTNVYNNTENTNRAAFNNHVDWNTYQRKP